MQKIQKELHSEQCSRLEAYEKAEESEKRQYEANQGLETELAAERDKRSKVEKNVKNEFDEYKAKLVADQNEEFKARLAAERKVQEEMEEKAKNHEEAAQELNIRMQKIQ